MKAILEIIFSPLFIFMQWLAEDNILFTAVKEGTVKAIMRGKSFARMIMAFAGFHLNDPTKPWFKADHVDWEILYHGPDNLNGFAGEMLLDEYYDKRGWFQRYAGLYWVGWPWANNVYVYRFEWNETRTDANGKAQVFPRAEPTDYIRVSDFTYAIVTDGAETEDRLPIDVLTQVTVAIRNAYRALFSGENWMRRATSAINRQVRHFIGNRKFEALISAAKSTDFSKPIIDLNEKFPDDSDPKAKPPFGLQKRYGVEIRTADLQTIALSGDLKDKDQEATTREYFAKQEAKATRVTGQATADVIAITGAKEAEALAARLRVIKAHGTAGITLAGFDAIREASKSAGSQIIWANDPLGAVAGILKPKNPNDKGGNK